MMAYLAALWQTGTRSAILVVVYALWMLSEIVVGGIIPSLRRHGAPIRYEDNGFIGRWHNNIVTTPNIRDVSLLLSNRICEMK